MNSNMKIDRRSLAAMAVPLLLISFTFLSAQLLDTTYCCFPPFTWKTPTPNVLIMLDNSGSMADRAYTTTEIIQGSPDDTIKYYGYFNPDSNYVYRTTGSATGWFADPAGPYPGHILNWAVISRGDVAKKVLIGGRGPSTWAAASDPVRLEGEGRSSYSVYYRSSTSPSSNYSRIDVTHDATMLTYISVTRVGTGPLPSIGSSVIWVYIPRSSWGGVLAQIADINDDGIWDDNVPRFGICNFNYGPGGLWDGYDELTGTFADNGGSITGGTGYIGDVTYTACYQAIRNVKFDAWTPLGECYWEMLRYFSQAEPFYGPNYVKQVILPKDPYYDKGLPGPTGWAKMTPCRQSFILLVSDGNPTKDLHVPNTVIDMPDANNLRSFATYTGSGILPGPNTGAYSDQGSNYLVHMAYYGNITDLRPDTLPAGAWWLDRNLPDDQNVALYGIAAFVDNPLLRDACKFGGFIDNNDNRKPDQQVEWDADLDGKPDTYFFARDGYEIEMALKRAILSMIARTQSASPVAVVSTGSRTGGLAIQSQFYQVKLYPATNEMLDWIGTTHSLWLDPYGLLREDTEADATLNLENDYVINMISHQTGVTIVRYRDLYGNGQVLDSLEAVPIDSLKPIWNAGEWLYDHSTSDRTIKAFVDANKNMTVDAGEIIDFVPGNAPALRPYLGVASDAAADTIVRYIMGTDFPDLRTRTTGGRVWKLGDVVNSGPTLVGRPVERYDFIYGDASYAQYFNLYRNRRQVVYVGSNDGMLHCFNGGISIKNDNALAPISLDPAGYDLGEELWAYIPYNLLPHLKWLSKKGYDQCHSYYVDLRAYITDAQIFDPADPKYMGGWGTLLIGGMRLGGLPIATGTDTCSSAFFAIDVTDPHNPIPLWEYSPQDLALTTCFSTVVKVRDRWFLVFGSGPQSCSGECSQNARIFILDLKTGALLRKITLADVGSFISNIFACDWGIDYSVDRIYFGDAYYEGPPTKAWRGKIYRILTNDDTNPANWTWSFVMDMQRPVTAEGSVATDEYNHLWVYFGTGRLYSEFDVADTTTQQLYIGFRDDTVHTPVATDRYNVTDVWVDTLDQVHIPGGGIVTFDSLKTLVNNRLGWYRWMRRGERSITSSLVIGGAVLFTSFKPGEDICSYGGTGQLYALHYLTGTAYIDPFLGVTGDTNRTWVDLGAGMPSEPSLYVTADQTKVFVQVGGVIVSPETGIPGLPRSGVILWKGR